MLRLRLYDYYGGNKQVFTLIFNPLKFFVYFIVNLAEIKITFKVSIHENARLRVCIITFYEYKDLHRYTFCFPYAQNDTR